MYFLIISKHNMTIVIISLNVLILKTKFNILCPHKSCQKIVFFSVVVVELHIQLIIKNYAKLFMTHNLQILLQFQIKFVIYECIG